jgi:hypothetical protein
MKITTCLIFERPADAGVTLSDGTRPAAEARRVPVKADARPPTRSRHITTAARRLAFERLALTG